VTIKGAHHFLQEDAAPELTRIIIDHMTRSGILKQN
jgi:hypothetical protein